MKAKKKPTPFVGPASAPPDSCCIEKHLLKLDSRVGIVFYYAAFRISKTDPDGKKFYFMSDARMARILGCSRQAVCAAKPELIAEGFFIPNPAKAKELGVSNCYEIVTHEQFSHLHPNQCSRPAQSSDQKAKPQESKPKPTDKVPEGKRLIAALVRASDDEVFFNAKEQREIVALMPKYGGKPILRAFKGFLENSKDLPQFKAYRFAQSLESVLMSQESRDAEAAQMQAALVRKMQELREQGEREQAERDQERAEELALVEDNPFGDNSPLGGLCQEPLTPVQCQEVLT